MRAMNSCCCCRSASTAALAPPATPAPPRPFVVSIEREKPPVRKVSRSVAAVAVTVFVFWVGLKLELWPSVSGVLAGLVGVRGSPAAALAALGEARP